MTMLCVARYQVAGDDIPVTLFMLTLVTLYIGHCGPYTPGTGVLSLTMWNRFMLRGSTHCTQYTLYTCLQLQSTNLQTTINKEIDRIVLNFTDQLTFVKVMFIHIHPGRHSKVKFIAFHRVLSRCLLDQRLQIYNYPY